MLSGLAPRCLRVEPHPGPALALPPQGKYSVKDPRVALALCSPEVSASTAALLEGVFQTLGFESCRRQGASVQVSPHLPPLPQPLPSAPPGASLHSGWPLNNHGSFLPWPPVCCLPGELGLKGKKKFSPFPRCIMVSSWQDLADHWWWGAAQGPCSPMCLFIECQGAPNSRMPRWE